MCVEYMRENGRTGQSEIGFADALEVLERMSPVKVTFNNIILYDDFDSEESSDGSLKDLIFKRFWSYEKYIVTSINIEVVDFHHTIVSMYGAYSDEC